MSLRLGGSAFIDSPSVGRDATKITVAFRLYSDSAATYPLSALRSDSGSGSGLYVAVDGVSFANPTAYIDGTIATFARTTVDGPAKDVWTNFVFVWDTSVGNNASDRIKQYVDSTTPGTITAQTPVDPWSTNVGSWLTTAGALRVGENAAGCKLRMLDFFYATGVAWTSTDVGNFIAGRNPLSITASPTLYQRLKTGINDANDVGTFTNTSGTFDTTSDPTTDDPPSTAQLAYPISDISIGTWLAGGTARNLLTYTESFDNAAWGKTHCSISADAATDPSGALTADTLVEDTATTAHSLIGGAASTQSVNYACSVYVRPNGRNFVSLVLDGPNLGAFFNLSSGTVGTVDGGVTASIVASTNGYYRCGIVVNAGAFSTSFVIEAASADGVFVYAGSGAAALDLWGAQFEQASTISDYQPILTTSAPTTPVYPVLADGGTGTPVDGNYGFVLVPGSILKVGLSPLNDPASSSDHKFIYRAYSPQSCSVQYDVYFGSTFITSGTQLLTAGVVQYTVTLTGTEADTIPSADYQNGQIWLRGV